MQSFRTDPPTVDIALVNENVYPPVTVAIASGVDSEKGSYTIKAHGQDVSDTDAGYVTEIQSPRYTITDRYRTVVAIRSIFSHPQAVFWLSHSSLK